MRIIQKRENGTSKTCYKLVEEPLPAPPGAKSRSVERALKQSDDEVPLLGAYLPRSSFKISGLSLLLSFHYCTSTYLSKL